jgi:hypothetical protein
MKKEEKMRFEIKPRVFSFVIPSFYNIAWKKKRRKIVQ